MPIKNIIQRFEHNAQGRDFVMGDIHGAFHFSRRIPARMAFGRFGFWMQKRKTRPESLVYGLRIGWWLVVNTPVKIIQQPNTRYTTAL